MSWYLLADGNLYKAERTINAPGWSLDENTPRDQPVHGWTWYEDDDAAMLATGLAVSITARLDRIDPPRTPEEQVAYEAQLAIDRAILDATAALMEDAHEDGKPWVQPTGAHNAYPLGRTVTHNGKTWVNLTSANTHKPGVSGWREVVAEGYPAWVQPAGGHDAYILGAKVTHNGRLWECTRVAFGVNAYAPGVWGWTDIGAAT